MNFLSHCTRKGFAALFFSIALISPLALAQTAGGFVAGWNLAGNGYSTPIDVASSFGDPVKVASVWKWMGGSGRWAFHTPSLSSQALQAYAKDKDYDVLTTIYGGEGYWVNAAQNFSFAAPGGAAVSSSSFQSMNSGWNLIAIGDNKTPAAFNNALSQTPPSVGTLPDNLMSLWAWEPASSQWRFYAPRLDGNGSLAAYNAARGQLNFGNMALGATAGFWVNSNMDNSKSLIRRTQFGNVEGRADSSVMFWGGIPYAAPPVNTLRWKSPIDPKPWANTRLATRLGNACIQKSDVLDNSSIIPQSEDCLTLNIWSPASGETRLPVLFFIHGGSNKIGYGGASAYSGAKLASDQKVVVVSINYRLNLFGWLYQAALQSDDDPLGKSGNFGTLDIIQALKFVRNNIASFGGDPANVTIAGQSAGGINVWSLLASPKAAGLFHKAVPMSGALPSATTAQGVTFATYLLRMLVINEGKATSAVLADAYINSNLGNPELKRNYLRNRSENELINAFKNSSVEGAFAANFLDGTVLPPDFENIFRGNFLNNVPVISGITNEEGKEWGSYFATNYSTWASVVGLDPNNPTLTVNDVIDSKYIPVSRRFNTCTDAGFNALMLNAAFNTTTYTPWCLNGAFNTTWFWSRQIAALNKYQPLQAKTYAYNFKWAQQPEPIKTIFGAAHTVDVPFLFGTVAPGKGYWSAAYIYTGLSNGHLEKPQFVAPPGKITSS